MTPVGSLCSLPFTRLEIKSARPAELLSLRFVTGSGDEHGKLRDGYFMSVHPKRFDRYFMDRRFVRHSVFGAHQEVPAIDEHRAVTLSAGRFSISRFNN